MVILKLKYDILTGYRRFGSLTLVIRKTKLHQVKPKVRTKTKLKFKF